MSRRMVIYNIHILADLKIINIGCKVFERGKDSFGG